MSKDDRIKKLASQIEALTRRDRRLAEKTREVEVLRRKAACELHSICASFVESVNRLLTEVRVELAPSDYAPEMFRDPGVNIIQINTHGRIIHITFEATHELVSTEHFRTPYILEGEVRAYNQEMLDRVEIESQLLFYCLEREQNSWRLFDRRSYRNGLLNDEFLVSLMERLV